MSDWKPIFCLIAVSLSVSIASGQTGLAPLQPETGVVQQGVEVLTRGPVHEAFAEPLAAKSVSTVTAAVAVPRTTGSARRRLGAFIARAPTSARMDSPPDIRSFEEEPCDRV